MENNTEKMTMDWKNSKALKWALVFVFLAFALFTFLKDRGYCDEAEYVDPGVEFNYEFPEPPIPVEEEYQFQHYDFGVKIPVKAKCAGKWVNPYDHVWKDNPYNQNKKTPAQQRQEWQDEYDQHHYDAVRTYNDAYNRIWWLPDLTLRQLGRDAWVSACAMAGTKTVSQALVMAFATMLSQYGLHCMDEWDYIQDKLYWSNYHFDECVRLASLLNKR